MRSSQLLSPAPPGSLSKRLGVMRASAEKFDGRYDPPRRRRASALAREPRTEPNPELLGIHFSIARLTVAARIELSAVQA